MSRHTRMPTVNTGRRRFLKASAAVGGGLVIGFCLPAGNRLARAEEQANAPAKPVYPPNAFVRIARDDSVTLICNKSEMGQGVYTSLAMLIAEELECDWSKVRVESAPVAPVYNHTVYGAQITGGSTSVSSSWEQLRTIGAQAREMLIAAAAQEWQVDPASCHAENSEVVHTGSDRKLSFGALADKAAALPMPEKVSLKPRSQFKLIGKPTRRLDTPEKTDGRAQFGLDVSVPDMLVVLIARSPVFGGRMKSLDASAAKAVKGVVDVQPVPTGVAVAATGFWAAKKGRAALKIEWDEGDGATLSTSTMREQFASLAKTPGLPARQQGQAIADVMGDAETRLEAEYEVPYLAHASMEPLNCVVDLRADSCEIWTGTQFQSGDRAAAAAVAGLKPEQVSIHTTFLGGGFGRRGNPHSDFVTEAVQVAKAIGKPVKVMWTREDDTRGGYYRPMWYDYLRGALDDKGNIVAWGHTIVGQSIMAGTAFASAMIKDGIDAASVEGAADLPYTIPNLLVDLHSPVNTVPVQWWRSVGHSHTAFVVECFLDELAHLANRDPLELRRSLLGKSPRHLAVLELAAKQAGWGTPLPKGQGRGLAVHESFGSVAAQVAEVAVDGSDITVKRVVCAIDCGQTVNPDTIRAQIESAVVYGLSAALHSAITLKDGRVEQGNFDSYVVLRLPEMPVVEVHIVPSDAPPSGVGEPGTPPIAPAVGNAIFAATGQRLRSLPFQLKA